MVSLNCFKSRKKSKKRSRDKNASVKSPSSSDDNGLLSPRSNASGIKTLNSNASTKDTAYSTSLSGISRNTYQQYDDSSIPTIDSDYNHLGNTNFSLSDAGGTIGSRSTLANFSHATSAFGGDVTIGNTVAGGGDSIERRMYSDVYNMTGGHGGGGGYASAQHLSHLIQPPSLQNDNPHHRNGGNGSASVQETLVINAPRGKLGVVIDTPMSSHTGTTMPIVHAVKDSSPIADRIQVGDKLIAVDGEDVTKLTAIQVSKLLARKSEEEVRRLTVVRVLRGRGGIY